MDTTQINITGRVEYDALLLIAYEALGLPERSAQATLRGRYPAHPADVRIECRDRGLALDANDLAAYLEQRFGQIVEPDAIGWPPRLIDDLLGWASAHDRGRSVEALRIPRTVADMLGYLRSSDVPYRIIGGSVLAKALGAGLAIAGEHREDVELIVGPQISDLIGRAMSGDQGAVDALEAHITADPSAAFQPEAVVEPGLREAHPWNN